MDCTDCPTRRGSRRDGGTADDHRPRRGTASCSWSCRIASVRPGAPACLPATSGTSRRSTRRPGSAAGAWEERRAEDGAREYPADFRQERPPVARADVEREERGAVVLIEHGDVGVHAECGVETRQRVTRVRNLDAEFGLVQVLEPRADIGHVTAN